MQSAAKVGLLLVVFIGLVAAGFQVLGHSLFAKAPNVYYADFADASGINEGTRILMSGVKVGTVGKITLVNATTARMTLDLDPTYTIPKGTVATIPSSLIGLGDAPLALMPPANAVGKEALGAVLKGTRQSPLDSILPNSKETVAEMTRTLTAMRKLLEDGSLKTDVHKLMSTSTATIERFGNLAGAFQVQLARNQDELHRALSLGTQAVADVQHVTAAVVKLLDEGTFQNGAKTILAQLQATSLKADKLVGSMNDLLNDPKLRGPMNKAAQNVADLTEGSKAIVANVTDITASGKTIAESADKIAKNGVTLSEKASKVADGAIEIEAQLQALLEKVNGLVGKGSKGVSLPKISGEMSLVRESEPGHLRQDVEINVPVGKAAVRLGVFDAFEKNGLTVQYDTPLSPSFDVRYGIFAGKPGLGVDYASTSRVGLRTDVWDLNDPRFDARLKFDLGGGFVGWLGLDRIFRDNSPSVGFGVKF